MKVYTNQIEKRSWLEVSLSQIRKNYMIYKDSLEREAKIMAVIKADAYGHGDVQIARVLSDLGVDMFAVSNIDEAVGLRDAGIKGEILILGYSSPLYVKTLYERNLTQTIVSEEYAHALSASGIKIKCQFALDTGMNRVGLDADKPDECIKVIRQYYSKLEITGIFTHLCVADSDTEECKDFTWEQIIKFKGIADRLRDLKLPYVHCCNSAGGLSYLTDDPQWENIGDVVRLGIVLYGLKPNISNVLPVGIFPAMTWKSVVSMVKDVLPGETIGYGRTFKVCRAMRIATITTGYADGLNRNLSNKGFVMINGYKAPIVGRICMDQTLVDVTDIPDVKMGDIVVILGRCGDLEYAADDMAKDLNTIGYEIICNINKRVQRFYVNSTKDL